MGVNSLNYLTLQTNVALSAGALEYAKCISTEV